MRKISTILSVILCLAIFTSCSLGTSNSSDKNNGEGDDNTTQTSPLLETPSGQAPGLYNSVTGELKYTWAELQVRGFVTVKENFVTKSVDYLIGDLYIPNGILGIGKSAFSGCTGLVSVSTGDGITTIGNSAFNGCTGLIRVELGNSITNIGTKAFGNCTRLQEISIPDSVTNIGANAFLGCTGLKSAHIGDGVTNIGSSTFSGCAGLKSVRIGKNVTYIGTNTFKNCEVLATVNYNGTKNSWNAILIDKKNDQLYAASVITTDPPIIIEDNSGELNQFDITE